jgi:UPF0716 family protein affecting phage T7 exclusion
MFRGDLWSASAALGLGMTVLLVVLGTWFGTRTFRRESA